jgi:hypothetical protein
MKTTLLSAIIFALALCSQAQTNLVLTNDVPIGHSSIHFGLVSYAVLDSTPNAEEAFKKQKLLLFADERSCQLFYNVTTNPFAWVRLIKRTTIQMELMTTNGIAVPKSAEGKAYFKEPKEPTQISGMSGGASDLPRLTDLFEFPSNGEYILEARYWYWDAAKRQIALSEPVRVKVIVRSIGLTNTPSKLNSTRQP